MPALTHCSQRQRIWPQDHAAQGPAVSFSCPNAQARPSAKQPAASGASRSDATQRLAQQPPSRRPPSSSSNPTPSAQPRPSSTCPRSFSPSSAAHAPRASSSRVYQAPPQAARCCSLAGSVAGGLSRSASAALSGPYSARLSLPRLVSVSPPASSVPVQYWCCPPASANLITLSRGPAKHHPPNSHQHSPPSAARPVCSPRSLPDISPSGLPPSTLHSPNIPHQPSHPPPQPISSNRQLHTHQPRSPRSRRRRLGVRPSQSSVHQTARLLTATSRPHMRHQRQQPAKTHRQAEAAEVWVHGCCSSQNLDLAARTAARCRGAAA